MSASTIDVWMQHPPAGFLEQPMFASLLKWIGMKEVPKIPLAASVATMDAAAVRVGLIAAWHGPQGALISNDQVAGWVAEYPDRLRGLASVDLYRPMEAVRELRRRVREDGFVGLRIVPWLWNLPPDDRRYYPLYAECIELDVPFCTQIGHTGPLCPSEPGRPIPYLENVALEFPELRIVAGHVGFPWINEALSLATKFPNVYLDTSAYKAKRYPPEFAQFLCSHGSSKVMFGSNYPMLTAADAMQGMDALPLSDEARRQLLFENAERVFRLG